MESLLTALSKDLNVGTGGILTSKAASQTIRTGNVMNVQDLSAAYRLNVGQLSSFKQLVLAGTDGSTNIYEVSGAVCRLLTASCVHLQFWSGHEVSSSEATFVYVSNEIPVSLVCLL